MSNTFVGAARALLFSGLCVLLSACGGDVAGIDGTGGPAESTYMAARVTALGPAAAAGPDSVTVNGVRYDASNAEVIMDGQLGSQNDLAIGQIVMVDGTIDEEGATGVANTIRHNTSVLGPIDSIIVSENRFRVLGQDILVDDKTLFTEGVTTLVQLQESQLVRISGFLNSLGQTVATYIDVSVVADTYKVVGPVSELDVNNKTLKINQLLVSYQQAGLPSDVSNGDVLEVHGSFSESLQQLLATESVVVTPPLGESGRRVELEGLINRVNSSTAFDLHGVAIVVPDEVVYVNGSAEDIAVNVRVEVEGSVSDDGRELIAERIIFIHTLILSDRGDIGENQTKVFTFESTDADKGLWVNLKNHSDFPLAIIKFALYAVEGEALSTYCYSTSTFCYVDIPGAGNWQIVLRSQAASSYELTAYFRRAQRVEARTLTAGEPIVVDAVAGVQRAYTLAAAPDAGVLQVTLGEVDQDFHFYVMADDQPTARRHDCRRRVAANGYATCYVLADRALEHWHIVVEGARDGRYQLQVDYIEPIALDAHSAQAGTLDHGAALYRIKADELDVSLAAVLSDVVGNVTLWVQKNTPPIDWSGYCGARGQCIVGNDSASDWYIMLFGTVGSRYNLTAFTQTLQPPVVDFTPGETLHVVQQAGVRAIYRLPAGEPGSVMIASLVSDTDNQAPFRLIVSPDFESSAFTPCNYYDSNFFKASCFYRNDDVPQARYIVVEGVFAGGYSLSLQHQQLTRLVSGETLTDTLTEPHGALYQLDVGADINSVAAVVNEASAPGRIILMEGAPKITAINCSRYSMSDQRMCVHRNTQATSWYVYVTGEMGTHYTLTAAAQPLKLAPRILTPGETLHIQQQAAVQAHYILPPGPPGSVLTAVLSDMDANFNLYLDAHPIVFSGRSDFSSSNPGLSNDELRVIHGADDDHKYLLVQGAMSGAYSLFFDYLLPTQATAGVRTEGVVEHVGGQLYVIDFEQPVAAIKMTLSGLSDTLNVRMRAGGVPGYYSCPRDFSRYHDAQCVSHQGAHSRWYVLIRSEENEAYDFVVEAQ
ncbi:MAG: hypothetical protein KTR20_02330 [Cellvibrionaceae bacterium]|nr:hypothetical protein [Cellvibrionaceae bacterium]